MDSPDLLPQTNAPRPRRPRGPLRIYASLLSISIVVLLGMVVGLFVMPAVRDAWHERHYIETLLNAAESPAAMEPASPTFRAGEIDDAMKWWTARIVREPGRRDKFVNLWRAARASDRTFAVLGQVIRDAQLMGSQPADLQLHWFRLVRLSDPSPQNRARFVRSLLTFAPAEAELEAALTQAGRDSAAEVAVEVADVLPAWTNRSWALALLSELLGDPRPIVRNRAARAVAVIADELNTSASGRAAQLAFRGRLVIMAAQDQDEQVRASSCWALFRLGWMARSGFDLFDPQAAKVRQMAALFLSNPPVESDHTEPIVMQQSLEMLAYRDEDELTRQRAGIALGMLPFRAGATRPIDGDLVDAMVRSRDWTTVAIGCRLAGFAAPPAPPVDDEQAESDRQPAAAPLDLLLARIEQGTRPDMVSEQIAFALGQLATPPFGRAEDPEFIKQRKRAIAGLAVLAHPELIATTMPQGQPAGPATPRARLAVAVAAAGVGETDLLLKLASETLPQPTADKAPPDTLADMACVELARMAGDGKAVSREKLIDIARAWARDYSERLQRSGVLVLALLNDRTQNDWLLSRYHVRVRSADEPMTTVYQQLALLALGVNEVDPGGPAAAVNHLIDPARRTPGAYIMLALAGRIEAINALLAATDDADAITALTLLDNWHLRDHLADLVQFGPPGSGYSQAVPGVGLYPIPAADTELANIVARMQTWWFETHSRRLTFDAKDRVWRVKE